MYLPRGCGRVRRPDRAVQMKSELVGSRLLFCARALRTNGTRLARLSGGVRWGAVWSAIAAAVAVAIAVSDVYRRRLCCWIGQRGRVEKAGGAALKR